MRGAGFHGDAGQRIRQDRHQHRVVHAAAAGDHPLRPRLCRAQRIGDRAHAQRQQGGLHIGGGFVASQFRFHPAEVELVAAGGFRGRQREPWLVHQADQQCIVDPPLRRERPARVVGRAGMAQAPRVHQSVGGTGIEPAHRAIRGQQGEIGDAAEVQHCAVFIGRMQGRGMERRHQWRAMAAGGDIATAEIGDHAHAAAFGDGRGIAELQGEGQLAVRAMAQGLAVRADRFDAAGCHPACLDRRLRGLGECAADAHVEFADFVEGEHRRALAELDQPRAQRGIPGIGAAEGQRGARVRRVAGEAHQRGIDAVGAGAGNQAEEIPVGNGVRHAMQYRIGSAPQGRISPSCCASARSSPRCRWWRRANRRRAGTPRPRPRGSCPAPAGFRS